MTKEEDIVIDDEVLEPELKSILEGTVEGKRLFYRFIKKWCKFFDSLDKKDRMILLNLILDVSTYNEEISSKINPVNSETYSDFMFFLLTIVL